MKEAMLPVELRIDENYKLRNLEGECLMARQLFLEGGEAVAEAAISVGCRFFASYVITPTTEIFEHMAKRMPEVGGHCMVPESEIAAVSMVWGAGAAGARAMVASTSTGISLMQESFAELPSAEVPCVIVSMSRISLQGDYYQICKGGGHGDYHLIVLAPETGQECVDLTRLAFHLADKYRHPVVLLGDHVLTHTRESVLFTDEPEMPLPPKTWAASGAKGRERNIVSFMSFERKIDMRPKWRSIEANETQAESWLMKDADFAVVAYGTAARFSRPAIQQARESGIKVGLIRPITLWPYPTAQIAEAAENVKGFLVVELNYGQMVDDVKLAVNGKKPVSWFGKGMNDPSALFTGFGSVISSDEILGEIRKLASAGKEALL